MVEEPAAIRPRTQTKLPIALTMVQDAGARAINKVGKMDGESYGMSSCPFTEMTARDWRVDDGECCQVRG